jgi:hypothetical protein
MSARLPGSSTVFRLVRKEAMVGLALVVEPATFSRLQEGADLEVCVEAALVTYFAAPEPMTKRNSPVIG